MVYTLVCKYADDGEAGEFKDCEATVQALFNLTQIKFMVIQQQVEEANNLGDVSIIDGEFMLETKENLCELL